MHESSTLFAKREQNSGGSKEKREAEKIRVKKSSGKFKIVILCGVFGKLQNVVCFTVNFSFIQNAIFNRRIYLSKKI